MNREEKNIESQGETIRVLTKYKLSFECPHCRGEISEEDFNKGERIFQLINEKLRVIVENEVNFQKKLV